MRNRLLALALAAVVSLVASGTAQASLFPPYTQFIIANQLAPDAVPGACFTVGTEPVALVHGNMSCSGSGPSPVISVTASSPLASSGGTTPNISFTGILPVANGGNGSATPSLAAGTGISISGSWPFLTITNSSPSSGGTVTAVTATGPNLTSSGGTTPNIALAAAPAISGANFMAGTIPDASLATAPLTAVTASGVLASSGGTTPNITFTGILPVANGGTGSATPAETAGTGISITGTWPFLTITNTSPSSGGTVTAVTGTGPITSSGGTTPAISCATCVTSVTASTNITSSGGTTPNIALVAAPTVNTTNFNAGCTTYVPTDASGASLVITVNQAIYCQISAHLIWVSVVVTYPTNSNASAAQLTLPVANSGSSHNRFATTVSAAVANGITAEGDTGGNVIFINTISTGGANANSTLSAAQIGFAGIYQTI